MGEKYVKRHLQQKNLLGRQPQSSKITTKNNQKNDTCSSFSTKPPFPLAGQRYIGEDGTCGPFSTKPPLPLAGQRYIGEDCLNIEKTPSPSVPKVKMTDSLASYIPNSNFSVKFWNSPSALRKPLTQNRWKGKDWNFVIFVYNIPWPSRFMILTWVS